MTMLRLSNIANFLTYEQDLSAAIQYIGLTACSTNAPCRIIISRITADLTLTRVASFGYDQIISPQLTDCDLVTNQILNDAVRSNRVKIHMRDAEYRAAFSKLAHIKDDHLWQTAIFMPLLPNYIASMAVRPLMEDNEENRGYFELLRTIMNLYIQSGISMNTIKRTNHKSDKGLHYGEVLTERQSQIVTMIKEGLTNGAIGLQLGYSESLIRHETISIYEKLGIEGRRQLLNEAKISDLGDSLEEL